MRPASRPFILGLLTALLSLPASALLPPAAPAASAADDPPLAQTETSLTVERSHADTEARVVVTVETADGVPVDAAPVAFERRVEGQWRVDAELVTDADGVAEVRTTLVRAVADNVFRASYAGDATRAGSSSGSVAGLLRRRDAVLELDGPASVVDGRSATLEVLSRTRTGDPVRGDVQVLRREAGDEWRRFRTVTTGAEGRSQLRVRPRVDTRWRAVAEGQSWVRRARSEVLRVDNLPPVEPVRLPGGAPAPRIELPPQPRGTGRGAHPVVTTIPDGVWASMVGRSWHAGCPVGREGLRLLRVNYWGFDGYRHRGEVVAATTAVGAMSRALVGLYDARLPLRSLYRVDRFGWSRRLQGADDHASMAADNSSAFNCRQVVNRPGVRSPHSYGGSLDLNPWENPYRSATGLVPNGWWHDRTHPRVAWRSSAHAVVQVLARAGLRWTYGTGDSHHFDVVGSGRALPPRRCGGAVCH
jgi:5-hydroxyisourate hydrolase-like protein (transthyretin family)